MPHRNAIIHRYRIEFLGYSARPLDLARNQLPHILEVDVTGYELGERVGNGNDGFAEIGIFHARGAPQGARPGHVATMSGSTGTVNWHDVFLV